MKSSFPKTTYERNANIYKLLANPKRLEILNLIKYRELPVEEIVTTLKLPKANVSQHLSILRHAQLVTTRRDKLHVYYKITDARIIESCAVLKQIFSNSK